MALLGLSERIRGLFYRVMHAVRAEYWFPQVPLALIVSYGGYLLLRQDLGANWSSFYRNVETGELRVAPQLLPMVIIGGSLSILGLGLAFRSRVAWIMTLLLLTAAGISTVLGRADIQYGLLGFFTVLLALILFNWRRFNRANLAISTLFAITAIAMLVFYGTFGSFYLGQQFKPPITDLLTAFYFSIVTMTTVGYGDILPATSEARLFAVSIIMLGVAVFATSLTAVISPLIRNSIDRLNRPKDKPMQRRNHFIVIGNTPLAINTSRELLKRGRAVTRILKQKLDDGAADEFDIVIGDAGNLDTLREAGVAEATCVLAMRNDDSDNAFIVLAVKELGDHVKTVVAINDSSHMDRIRLVQPDYVISPEVFGAEVIAMTLSGEKISPDFLIERIFQKNTPKSAI